MRTEEKKYIEEIKSVILLSEELCLLAVPTEKDPRIKTIRESDKIESIKIRSKSIISNAFGERSIQYSELDKLITTEKLFHPSSLKKVKGFLEGIVVQIEKGILFKTIILLSSELFDDLLSQIQELLEAKYKDAAAILCRVLIENSLKRLADINRVEFKSKEKASKLSELLHKEKIISKMEWSAIQHWLVIGNHAAHGEFDKYKLEDIEKMKDDVRNFINQKFQTGE